MAASRQSSKKKEKLPFYRATGDKTSSSIIAEARKDLKSVSTKRPATPGDAARRLFGSHQPSAQQGAVKRPPSVYSLGRHHFNEGDLSRPPTGGQQLAPLEVTGSIERLQGPLTQTPPTPTSSMTSIPHPPIQPQTRQSSAGERTGLPPTPRKEGKKRATGESSKGQGGGAVRTVSAESTPKPAAPPPAEPHPPPPPEVQRHHSAGSVMEQGRGPSTTTSSSGAPSPKRTVSSPKEKAVAYWNTHIAPLLPELNPATQDTQKLCLLLDRLWEGLCAGKFLGRSGGVGGSKRRGTVLKAVFRLLDSKDPQLLLKVAKILFGMKVTGNNLQNACKLVFTLSKDEHNDPHFAKEGIVGPLLEVLECLDPTVQPDAVVYCMGAVKLLCSNNDLRAELVACGAVKSIANLLSKLTEPSLSTVDSSSSSSILIQLVGALRNLSDNISLREDFITHGVIAGLCGLLGRYGQDGDLMFVVSRLFSKLTLHSDCCTAVGSCRDDLPALCNLLTLHKDKPDLVVRVCFALGNLTTSAAASDGLRGRLVSPPCSLLCALTEVGRWYLEACPDGEGRSKHEDVLVKLQRVIANLAIDTEIGQQVAHNQGCTELLVNIVELHSSWESEEVLLNALAAINNLTFFATGDSLWSQQAERLGEVFLDLLLGKSKELRLDCLRVCGNLSRSQQVCHTIMEQRTGDVLVALLDSEDRELVYSACGVLLNVMIVPDLRPLLANSNGVKKLVDALRDFGHLDWQLSALVCKTLWNYSDKMTSSLSCFGEEEAELLIEQLEVYLDEELAVESVPAGVPEETRAFLHDMWRNEFCPVAKPLLERVKMHSSDLVPL